MKPAVIVPDVRKHTRLFLLLSAVLLTGCGLTQTVTDSTVALTKSVFYKQVNVLHLDIQAREAINNDDSGAALSTVVRIYQLKERQTFDATDYPSLFAADSQAIKADLLAQKDIRIRPGESVSIDMPMEKQAQFIAVAGMFITPNLADDGWRLVIAREDLEPDKARKIELNNQGLTLEPVKEK